MEQDNRLYICSFPGCSSMFSKPSRLLHHERTHSGERPYLCPHEGCSRSYTRPAHLNRHLATHGTSDDDEPMENKIRCEMDGCTKTFSSRDCLLKHRHRFHGKLYKCPVDGCEQVFKKHTLFKCHRAEHTDEKLFKCTHQGCDKSFSVRSKLKRHNKTHEGFTCSQEGCGKVFDKWSLFRKHVAVDHRTAFTCELCGKSFATKAWLKQHSAIHREERIIFHCTYEGCPRVYYCQRNLTAHVKSYHLGHRLKCEQCDRTFVNKQKLNNHRKLHDPNRPMPKKKPKKSSKKIPLTHKLIGIPVKKAGQLQSGETTTNFLHNARSDKTTFNSSQIERPGETTSNLSQIESPEELATPLSYDNQRREMSASLHNAKQCEVSQSRGSLVSLEASCQTAVPDSSEVTGNLVPSGDDDIAREVSDKRPSDIAGAIEACPGGGIEGERNIQ